MYWKHAIPSINCINRSVYDLYGTNHYTIVTQSLNYPEDVINSEYNYIVHILVKSAIFKHSNPVIKFENLCHTQHTQIL